MKHLTRLSRVLRAQVAWVAVFGLLLWLVTGPSGVTTADADSTLGSNFLSASPSPTGSPRPSPLVLYAPLRGVPLGGVTPNGLAYYTSNGANVTPGTFGGPLLFVNIANVNLVAGTMLDVAIGATNVGRIMLRIGGRGELHLNMNVPVVVSGATLTVKNGATTIASGIFSTTPPPPPTPTPRPSPSPNTTPTPRPSPSPNTTPTPRPSPSPNTTPTPRPSPSPNTTPTPRPSPSPNTTPTPRPSPSPTPGPNANCNMALSAATYSVGEAAGNVTITVNRTCTQAQPSTVFYYTERGTASPRTDYTSAFGRLYFAAGDTAKTFRVLITNDTLVEQAETFGVKLEFARGATLAMPREAIVTINDNDTPATAASNPLEGAQFFVRQHYADFLSREPDTAGLNYWAGQISGCGNDASCISQRRSGVSAAFFIEQEFGDTGYFVYRLYQASFGRRPTFDEFEPDRAMLVGGANLAADKADFADEWVERPAFTAEYPAELIPEQFVSRLFNNAGLAAFTDEQQAQIDAMYSEGRTRAEVLQSVIELTEYRRREYNKAFVLMQYFGYLRREPDQGGYDFWLGVINQGPDQSIYRGMVCAFITSAEMQQRFSNLAPRTNGECQ